jgi:hypothetical protein
LVLEYFLKELDHTANSRTSPLYVSWGKVLLLRMIWEGSCIILKWKQYVIVSAYQFNPSMRNSLAVYLGHVDKRPRVTHPIVIVWAAVKYNASIQDLATGKITYFLL